MTKFENELLEYNKDLLTKLQQLNVKYEALNDELKSYKALDKLDELIEQQMQAKGKQKITLFI